MKVYLVANLGYAKHMTIFESEQISTNALVGREVKSWMARLGYRQTDVAKLLGVAQPRISARLRGQAPFTIDELLSIAQGFQITLGELLGEPLVNSKDPRPAVRDEGLGKLPQMDSNHQPLD